MLEQHGQPPTDDLLVNLNEKFTFGKYKGYKVNYALKREPGYILWFYRNIEKQVLINEAIFNKAKDLLRSRRRQRMYDSYTGQEDFDDWCSCMGGKD